MKARFAKLATTASGSTSCATPPGERKPPITLGRSSSPTAWLSPAPVVRSAPVAPDLPAAPAAGGPRRWEVTGGSRLLNLRERPSTTAGSLPAGRRVRAEVPTGRGVGRRTRRALGRAVAESCMKSGVVVGDFDLVVERHAAVGPAGATPAQTATRQCPRSGWRGMASRLPSASRTRRESGNGAVTPSDRPQAVPVGFRLSAGRPGREFDSAGRV
jgi:hypothetical protein